MTTQHLILGQVEPDFDPERDIPIGPWCFAGAEHVYEGWEDLAFIKTFDGPDDIHANAEIAEALVRKLSDDLCEQLNARHGRSFGERYWRTIATPWLLAMVQVTWIAYHHVDKLVAQMKDQPLHVRLAGAEVDWAFVEYRHMYEDCVLTHDFMWWLYSLVLRRLAPDHWVLEEGGVVMAPVPDEPEGNLGLKGLLRECLTRRLRVVNVSGMSFVDKACLTLDAWMAPKREAARAEAFPASQEVLNRVPTEPFGLMEDVLRYTWPRYLGTGYQKLESWAAKRRYVPGKALIGLDMLGGTEDVFIAARAVQDGMRVIAVQHGGNYGLARTDLDAAEAEYAQDSFLTWGWTVHGDYEGVFRPLPSPLLSRSCDAHKEEEAKLVFVGGQLHLFSYRINAWPQPLDWIQARKDKVSFLLGLETNILGRTWYRPYFGHGTSLEDAEYVGAQVENLHILKGDLRQAMMKSRLLVLDHPGTTLNIAMVANIPTICYWDPEVWPVTEAAKACMDEFHRLGILHDTTDQASEMVNKTWNEIDDWWNGTEVQAARQTFRKNFAQADTDWRGQWSKAIRDM